MSVHEIRAAVWLAGGHLKAFAEGGKAAGRETHLPPEVLEPQQAIWRTGDRNGPFFFPGRDGNVRRRYGVIGIHKAYDLKQGTAPGEAGVACTLIVTVMGGERTVPDWRRSEGMREDTFGRSLVILIQPGGEQSRHGASEAVTDDPEEALLAFGCIRQMHGKAAFDGAVLRNYP